MSLGTLNEIGSQFSEGILGLLSTLSFVFLATELAVLAELVLGYRWEQRKGFTGARSSLLHLYKGRAIQFLRISPRGWFHWGAVVSTIAIMLAAGLLPAWAGAPALAPPHSVWLFWGLWLLSSLVPVFVGWVIRNGFGQPKMLTVLERTVGAVAVAVLGILILVISIGGDSFVELSAFQQTGAWLIFVKPASIGVLALFVFTTAYICILGPFAKEHLDEPRGWSLWRFQSDWGLTVWCSFIVASLLGAHDFEGVLGSLLYFSKIFALRVFISVASMLFIKVREDQAENFLLWRLAPLAFAFVLISVLVLGVGQ